MPIADTLKTRTAEMHRHAETRSLQKALVSGRASPEQLATYLAQLHLLHQTLEDLCRSDRHAALPALGACAHEHSRSIALDLDTLGLHPDILPQTRRAADDLLSMASERPLFALGALYVLEGSMNGNRYIARGFAKRLGIEAGAPGLSYWDPYGESQRERWQAFRSALDAQPFTQAESEAVLEGAAFMFETVAIVSDASSEAPGVLQPS